MVLGHKKILTGQTGHEAGRVLLRQMTEEYTDLPAPAILVGEQGKPCFAGDGPQFSITHTKRHVFCVLSDRPVGVDAEELDRQVKPGLAEKILSPAEYRQYEASADKNKALLTFWVLKEASAKATGEGIRGYPNKTDFRLCDPRVQEINGCVVAVVEL